MTFGQLLIELQSLKDSDPKLLECDLAIRDGTGEYPLDLAVTLPDRQLILINKVFANE